MPRIVPAEDRILRVTPTAICGSDLHPHHGLVPDTRIGYAFGHEAVGVIEEVGPEVTAVSVGDRVAVLFDIACGRCFRCVRRNDWLREGANPYDEMGGIYGYSRAGWGWRRWPRRAPSLAASGCATANPPAPCDARGGYARSSVGRARRLDLGA